MNDRAEEIVRKFIEIASNDDRMDTLGEIVSEDVKDRIPAFFQPPGRAGVEYKYRLFRQVYPEARSTLEKMEPIPEGIRVYYRTELEPGGPIQSMIGIFIVQNDRICEFSIEPLLEPVS